MGTQSKNHHFVPRSLLKNFSFGGNGKQVCVFDKTTGKQYVSSIAKSGSENYFNTVRFASSEFNFEEVFDYLDARLAAVVSRLIEAKDLGKLSHEEIEELKLLMCVQIARVKMWRTTTQYIVEATNEFLSELAQQIGVKPNLREVPHPETLKLQTLRNMLNLNQYYEAVENKDYYLIDYSKIGGGVCISDNPVVMSNSLPFGDIGLKEIGVELYFPLATTVVLACVCPSIRNKLEKNAAQLSGGAKYLLEVLQEKKTMCGIKDTLDYVNHLQIQFSSRFLYSATLDFVLAEEMIRRNPKLKSVKSSVTMQRSSPEYGNMPYGQFIILYSGIEHVAVEIGNLRADDYFKFNTGHIATFVDWKNNRPNLNKVEVIKDRRIRHMSRNCVIVRVDVRLHEVTIRMDSIVEILHQQIKTGDQ